jgi:DeoR/GlpR family transcriptional regulator of sugar metabolism
MIAAADQVVLAADATKFPGTGMARVCGADSLHVVVTNEDADPATLGALRRKGLTVITV